MTARHVTDPDSWIGCIIVQQKRMSKKESWTTHETLPNAMYQAAANRRYNAHNPWRFCYRVNFYFKDQSHG